MSTTVSIAWIPVIKDSESSSAVASLKGHKDQKLATPGLEHAYHGTPTDPNEPKAVEIIDVWSSPDAAKAAASSPQIAEVKKLLNEIMDKSNPEVRPVHNLFTLHGDFVKAAEAPVTQFAVTFVPPASAADFEATFNEVVKAGGQPDGFIAGAHGWGAEEIDHPKAAGKVKVYLSASGWASDEKAKAAGAGAQKTFEPLKKFSEHYHVRTAVLTKDK